MNRPNETAQTDTAERPGVTSSVSTPGARRLLGPLSTLRASLECLVGELSDSAAHRPALDRVLSELASVDSQLAALCAEDQRGSLDPQPHSVLEIVRSVVDALQAAQRPRVYVATDSRSAVVEVDLHSFQRCLAHLLDCALNLGSEMVLLNIRTTGEATAISIVEFSPQTTLAASGPHAHSQGATTRERTAEADAALALQLARQTTEDFCGHVEVTRSSIGTRRISLELPTCLEGSCA